MSFSIHRILVSTTKSQVFITQVPRTYLREERHLVSWVREQTYWALLLPVASTHCFLETGTNSKNHRYVTHAAYILA